MPRRPLLTGVALAAAATLFVGLGRSAWVSAYSDPDDGYPRGLFRAADPADSVIIPNDNRRPAGLLADGTLAVRLEAAPGVWFPEGPLGASLPTAAFREEGRPLQTPGPLIRVPAGTAVRVSIRNSLGKPMRVFGLGAERGSGRDSLVIAAGEVAETRFMATTPGTYYYSGQTTPGPITARATEDPQLNGAIVVEDPGAPRRPVDRIFVISWWFTIDSASPSGLGRATMAINGRSWPHTERLDLAQGDSAHWRWINLTNLDHPMHLHGFYFRIDAKGDDERDTLYVAGARRMAVTEIVGPRKTMRMSWSPTRAGNWIMHCHFVGHITPELTGLDAESGHARSHDAPVAHVSDRPHHMSALVLGIRVAPRGPQPAASTRAERPIRLLVRSKARVYGDRPGWGFVLGGTPAERDTTILPIPGPALVLERGEPVAVTIVNTSHEQTAVHWHGIELESFPDGVPHWSGAGKTMLPTIMPGDSLTVRFTPPRAGTFMYHSHFNEFQQIPSGLHAPIIVLEPGQRFDPETDRVLLFSEGGPTTNVIVGPFAPPTLNGQVSPVPIELRAGTTYRFRLINIAADIPVTVKLLDGTIPVEWRALAKDGMDLPEWQRTVRPADLGFEPGEIYDFEFTPPRSGTLRLEFGFPLAGPVTPVTVRVR